MSRFYVVADSSKNLKGVFVKQMKDTTASVIGALVTLEQRASACAEGLEMYSRLDEMSREIKRLREDYERVVDENRRMKETLDNITARGRVFGSSEGTTPELCGSELPLPKRERRERPQKAAPSPKGEAVLSGQETRRASLPLPPIGGENLAGDGENLAGIGRWTLCLYPRVGKSPSPVEMERRRIRNGGLRLIRREVDPSRSHRPKEAPRLLATLWWSRQGTLPRGKERQLLNLRKNTSLQSSMRGASKGD